MENSEIKRREALVKIAMDGAIDWSELFGSLDWTLEILGDAFGVAVTQRNGELALRGGRAAEAAEVIKELIRVVEAGEPLDRQKIHYIISLRERGLSYQENNVAKDTLCFTHKGKPLKPKTIGQKLYANSIKAKDIVFGIGPAGTGKTFIAVAKIGRAHV